MYRLYNGLPAYLVNPAAYGDAVAKEDEALQRHCGNPARQQHIQHRLAAVAVHVAAGGGDGAHAAHGALRPGVGQAGVGHNKAVHGSRQAQHI